MLIGLAALAVVAIGGAAFFFLTGSDTAEETGTSEPTTPTFDPQATYEPSDPAAVVTRMRQAVWAGDCETAAPLIERALSYPWDKAPLDQCVRTHESLTDPSRRLLEVDLQPAETLHNDGDFALVQL